jgi:hypothetical protein
LECPPTSLCTSKHECNVSGMSSKKLFQAKFSHNRAA